MANWPLGQAFCDFFDCPSGMLCDQRLRVDCRALECRQVLPRPNIAQRHANISQETAAFDSFDRRLPKKLPKFRITQSQIIAEGESSCRCFGREGTLAGDFCESIPGTSLQ